MTSAPEQGSDDLEKHWRDLFISDLVSLLEWDARHGNPELFKAVEILKKRYSLFTVEQHDLAVATAAAAKENKRIREFLRLWNNDTYNEQKKRITRSERWWYDQISDVIRTLKCSLNQLPESCLHENCNDCGFNVAKGTTTPEEKR